MEWETIVCLTSNWRLLKVLQHVMPGIASGDGWGILPIPSWPRHPWTCFERPVWLQDWKKHRLLCCIHGLVLGTCWQLQQPSLLQTVTGTRKGGGKEPAQPLCAHWAQCFLWRSLHAPSFPFFPFKSWFFQRCSLRFHFHLFAETSHLQEGGAIPHLFVLN